MNGLTCAKGVALRLLFVAGLVATGCGGAMAQQPPDDADRAACRSDAIKFCRAQIGKPKEVLACLAKVKDQISAACAAVVTANGR